MRVKFSMYDDFMKVLNFQNLSTIDVKWAGSARNLFIKVRNRLGIALTGLRAITGQV